MGAKIIKIDTSKKDKPDKPLTPFQKKLLEFPIMSEEEKKEFEKVNKWMRKWKV